MAGIGLQALTCPGCATAFEVWAYAGPDPMAGQTTDLRSLGATSRGFGALIHDCPRCGFVGTAGDFAGTMSPEAARLIAERLTPLVGTEQTPQRRFEHAAWVAEWRGAPAGNVGDLYLYAAWCCAAETTYDEDTSGQRTSGDEETAYRRQAIARFERALAGVEYQGLQRAVVTYVVGECYRRVGDQPAAARWFDAAVELARATPDGDRLAVLADQQKNAPREEW